MASGSQREKWTLCSWPWNAHDYLGLFWRTRGRLCQQVGNIMDMGVNAWNIIVINVCVSPSLSLCRCITFCSHSFSTLTLIFFKFFSEFIHTHHKSVNWKAKIIQTGKKNAPNDWYIQLRFLCGDLKYSKCNAGNQSTGRNLVGWNIILINEFISGTLDVMTIFFFVNRK